MSQSKEKPLKSKRAKSSASPDVEAQPPSEAKAGEESWRELIFFRKLGEDRWEAWAWAALGLFVCTILIWVVALLRLGSVSVQAYGVGVALTGMMSFPVMIWGMIKTMLNPPIFRPSRTIAFTSLLVISFLAQKPLFEAPVSTEQWTSDHEYTFPLQGPWYVLNGGDSMETNRLATAPAVRYGMALTKLDEKGQRHTGDGSSLDQFFCYGQPVVAPRDGVVVRAVDKVKDNAPGKGSGDKGYSGNHVVLKLGPQEFFFVFYLKKGSIAVKDGDKVVAGQRLGECGNSGISDYPQVQFHFQNSADYPLAEGLPVRFKLRSGKSPVESGMGRGPVVPNDLKDGQIVEALKQP